MSERLPTPRKPPFSLRLTFEERAQLEQKAGSQSLSSYVKQTLFAGAPGLTLGAGTRRVTADQTLLAKILAKLGESDLAGSMRRLTGNAPSHVRAFSAWLLDEQMLLRDLIAEATAAGQQRHAEHVAILGYASATGLLADTQLGTLQEDIAQLAGRSHFAGGRPWRFELDGVALFGVALGIVSLGPKTNGAWLSDVLRRSAIEVAADAWNLGLVRSAQRVLGDMAANIEPDELAIAMARKGIGAGASSPDRAWDAVLSLVRPETADRAAARLVAMQDLAAHTSQIVPRTATRDDLVAVLEGTTRSLKRWPYGDATPQSRPALWEIDNEYNVQDLLWAVLAPLFPDLEDEESLPSLGPKHPRADLGVPRLRTIIEVKYLRNDKQSDRAKLIEQVAADASLYLAKTTAYDSIIAFIWDDAGLTDQHHEIKMGLEAISGIIGAVIVPRPAKMRRPAR